MEFAKKYIREKIEEVGLDENGQIKLDFTGIAEEAEIKQAAQELGYEVEAGQEHEGAGVYWICKEDSERKIREFAGFELWLKGDDYAAICEAGEKPDYDEYSVPYLVAGWNQKTGDNLTEDFFQGM